MTRLVPASAAAASRLSVPLVRSSLVTANTWSVLRRLRMSAKRGHLVHDHLRLGGPHRRDHRRAIKPVEDHRRRARLAQLPGLAGRPGGRGDLMARRDQPGDEVPSQCPGRPGDEDSHGLSSYVVLSLLRQGTTRACDIRGPPAGAGQPAARLTPLRARSAPRRRGLASRPPQRTGAGRGTGAGAGGGGRTHNAQRRACALSAAPARSAPRLRAQLRPRARRKIGRGLRLSHRVMTSGGVTPEAGNPGYQ